MNGDAVSECAGLQLPILIMDAKGDWEAYYILLQNQFHSDINIAVNGEIYPELVAMNFPEKISELWGEFYLNPKMRYQYMKRHDKVLLQMQPECGNDESATELVQDSLNFRRYHEPRSNTVNSVLEQIELYKNNAGLRDPWLYKGKGSTAI